MTEKERLPEESRGCLREECKTMKWDMEKGDDWTEGGTTEGAFKTLLNAGSTKRERNGHLARIVNPLNED